MKPTRPGDLVLLFVLGVGGMWIGARFWYGSFPPVATYAGGSLLLVAAAEALWGLRIRRRIADGEIGPARSQLHPIAIARSAALAQASALVGATLAGVWLGLLAYVFPRRVEILAAGRDVPGSVIGVLSAAVLIAAALWLEYCCRAPGDRDEHGTPGTGSEEPA